MRSSPVRRFIINNLSNHQKDIIRMVVRKFGFSRQAALRHMYILITDGKVTATGKTKDRRYQLKPLAEKLVSFSITPELKEDQIFHEKISPYLDNLASEIREICEYGFSQVMNNVISHSEGKTCQVHISRNEGIFSFRIMDDGVGVLSKVTKHFSLENEHHAVLELSKGNMTTDPDHHTGDGLFFVSRLFNRFILESSGLIWKHDLKNEEWSATQVNGKKGTSVFLEMNSMSNRSLKNTMKEYSVNGGMIFNRTCIPVLLSKLDSEHLFSRSQARRLTQNLDEYKNVCFDFTGLDMVSHSFADEVFRVYQKEKPHQKLEWKNSNIELEELFTNIQKNGKYFD